MEEVKLRKQGDSLMIGLPKAFRQHLGAEEGDILRVVVDQSKYGNFVGIWNPKQQKEE